MSNNQKSNKALNSSLKVADEICHLIVDIKSKTYQTDLNNVTKAVS